MKARLKESHSAKVTENLLISRSEPVILPFFFSEDSTTSFTNSGLLFTNSNTLLVPHHTQRAGYSFWGFLVVCFCSLGTVPITHP